MKIFLVLTLAACASHDDANRGAGSAAQLAVAPPAGEAGSGAAAGSGSAADAVALGSDKLPVACGEWRAALDKLDACAALPQDARASLKAVYTDVSKGWGQLPIDAKRKLGPICQAGADSVLKGAKATCGW